MSEILIGSNPDNPQVVGSYKMDATAEEKARQLPEPRGYRILCAIPEVEKECGSRMVWVAVLLCPLRLMQSYKPRQLAGCWRL